MLAGNNTYSGATLLGGGTLIITNDTALGVATNSLAFTAGTTLKGASNNVTLGAARTVTVSNNVTANIVVNDISNFNVAAFITGPGHVQKGASSYSLGTVRFSNDTNSFTGTFTAGYGNTEFTSVSNSGTACSLGLGLTNAGAIVLGNATSAGTLRYVGANNSSTTRPLNWTATGSGYALDVTNTGLIAFLAAGSLRSGSGGPVALTLQGSNSGTNTLAQVINDLSGATSVTKGGTGRWLLTAANAYSGDTVVNGGVLELNNATALPGGIASSGGASVLTLTSGGVVGLGNGDFSRNLGTTVEQVQFTGSGGFAAYGANRAVNLGGASAQVSWAAGSFVPNGNALVLGSSTANATVDFQNPIDLNGASRTVQVNDGPVAQDASLSGVVSGSAGLTKSGSGTLVLSGANTYTGPTVISGGVVELPWLAAYNTPNPLGEGSSGANNLVISNATLRYMGTNVSYGRTFRLDGDATLDASGTGQLEFYSTGNTGMGGTATASRTLILTGSNTNGNRLRPTVGDPTAPGVTSLLKTGAGQWLLGAGTPDGTNTYSGATTVSNGTLLVYGQLPNSPVTVAGGTLGGSGLLGGPVAVQAGGALAPGVGSIGLLGVNNTLSLAGSALMEVSKTGGIATNDQVYGISTLTYGGTLTVTLRGTGALAAGDTFQLFSATNYNAGNFTGTNLPGLAGSLAWSWTPTNGTLAVVSTNSAVYPPVLGGLTSISGGVVLTFSGTNGQSWKILSSTNLTKALINWDTITTGTFAGTPVSYTNTAPVDPQRFYIITSP